MKRASLILVCLLLVSVIASAGGKSEATGGGGKPEFIIKYASGVAEVLDKPDPDTAWAQATKKYIEEKSNGRIRVDMYFNNQLGGQTEMFQGVSSGAIEMAVLNGMTLENFYKNMSVLSLPGIFRDLDDFNKVLDSEWIQSFYKVIENNYGVIINSGMCTGFRNFTNNRRELKLPGDARGLRLRVMENPTSMRMVEVIGGQPVPIDWGEVYTALQNGVADGQENALSGVVANRVYEVQKYMILDHHMCSNLMGMISKKWFDTLPADLQTVVADGLKAGAEAGRAMMVSYTDTALSFLAENGVQIYKPTASELEQWFALYRTTPHEFVRTQIDDPSYINQMLEVIDNKRK